MIPSIFSAERKTRITDFVVVVVDDQTDRWFCRFYMGFQSIECKVQPLYSAQYAHIVMFTCSAEPRRRNGESKTEYIQVRLFVYSRPIVLAGHIKWSFKCFHFGITLCPRHSFSVRLRCDYCCWQVHHHIRKWFWHDRPNCQKLRSKSQTRRRFTYASRQSTKYRNGNEKKLSWYARPIRSNTRAQSK